ncbi:MAG: protease inhibitor I42 family protein [Dehalococcoidia bacterium]
MKPSLILVSAVLAISICTPACSGGTAGAPMEVSCDEFMKLKHISQQSEVAAGSTITLSLCSNPSTGFEWSKDASISDSTVIQQLDHKFIEPVASNAVGVPGMETWTFKALKQGTATLSLEYGRPWEGGEKGEWTYKLTITVK